MSELAGRLLLDGRLVPGCLRWEGEHIVAVERSDDVPLDAPVLAPGLIDLHVHGYGGCGPLDDLPGMAAALARAGTTAFQPTLFPARPIELGRAAESAWSAAETLRESAVGRAAAVLGLHLEGPFVNPECAGALPLEDLVEPSPEALRTILGPNSGSGRGVRTVTLAPELSGSPELIQELVRCGVRVSLGHSKASAEHARRAARAGAQGATHLFNAMAPLHHREVGLAGFALSDDSLFAELIGDLVHVGPEAVRMTLNARGAGGVCLVSDALQGAGTGCDHFHSHGRDHLLRDGAAWYPPAQPDEAPRLAGSALSQLEMVRRLCTRGVLSLEEALTAAGETPARALGVAGERGSLVPGARADVIELTGAELQLTRVVVGGVELA